MPHPGHHNIICPTCGTRMGGCRCMSENKPDVVNAFPCEKCKAASNVIEDAPLVYEGRRVGLVKLAGGAIEGTLTDRDFIARVTSKSWIGLSVMFETHDFDPVGGRLDAKCQTCKLSYLDGEHNPPPSIKASGGVAAPLTPLYDFHKLFQPQPTPGEVIKQASSTTPSVVIQALDDAGYEIRLKEPERPGLDGDPAECGHPNPVWRSPNELWNEIMDPTGDREDILCPACFVAEAAKRGVRGVWGLTLDHRTSPPSWMIGRETEIAAALHGSVRDAEGRTWQLHAFPSETTKSTWLLEPDGDPESWTRINEPGPVTFA